MLSARDPDALLQAWERLAAPLRRDENVAYWDFARRGDSASRRRWTEAAERASALRADPALYERVRAWAGDHPDDLRLQVLLRDLRPHQGPEPLRRQILELSTRVEAAHSTFRADVDGEQLGEHQLDGLLLRETRPATRRKLWFASRQVGLQVEADVRALARLRNELARSLGYADHYALLLDSDSLDAAALDALLDEVEVGTEPAWKALRGQLWAEHAALRGKAEADLMPWDFADRFLQSVPREVGALDGWFRPSTIQRWARAWCAGIGLPVGDLLDAGDLLPRPGKQPHAFCLAVDPPRDVRILANLDVSHRWMEILLHELGHGLYDRHLDPDLPWLLREVAHDAVTEGVAMFFARMARDPEWLRAIAQVPAERADAAARGQRESQLVFMRWALVVPRFEAALFADPDGDLDETWWSLVGRLQGLPRPAGARADWAAKLHIACIPGYYQNYVLGELLASQLRQRWAELGGAIVGDPGLGDWLIGLFRAGHGAPWRQTLHDRVGITLSPTAWLRAFARPESP